MDTTLFMDLYQGNPNIYSQEGRYAIKGKVTKAIVEDHLFGRKRLGIYPIIDGELTRFACIDVDEDNFDVANRIKRWFAKHDIPSYIESSKSKGFHTWVFFESPIKAWMIRRVCSWMFEELEMKPVETFPKQDDVNGTQEKVGNFIYIPEFMRDTLRKDNPRTCFVDENNTPYADQWEFIRTIKKTPPAVITAFIEINGIEETKQEQVIDRDSTYIPEEDDLNELPCFREIIQGGFKAGDGRNEFAFFLAKRWKAALLPKEEIWDRLAVWNARNKEPLSDNELAKIFNSVILGEYKSIGCERLEGLSIAVCDKDTCPMVEAKNEKDERIHAEEAFEREFVNPQKESPGLAFPDHLYSGIAKDFAEFYEDNMESPKVVFYFSFLTCLGNLISNKVLLKSSLHIEPRLYGLILDPSADGRKSTGANQTVNFFKYYFSGEFEVCKGIGSAEGLQKRLRKSPSGRLFLFSDEFKSLMSKAIIQGNIVIPCLNTLFESNDYETHTKTTSIEISNAHLSILGASTLATYESLWDGQTLDIGFTNRIFLIPGSTPNRKYSLPEHFDMSTLSFLVSQIQRNITPLGNFFQLELTKGARGILDDWYFSLERSIHTRRLDTYCHRLMVIYAINEGKVVVDEDVTKQAIETVNWQLRVRKELDPLDADNKFAQMEQRIRKRLKKGPATEYQLKKACHTERYGTWVFNTAFKSLRKGDEPEVRRIKQKHGKKVFYVLAKDDEIS